jgi:hypothetical protein
MAPILAVLQLLVKGLAAELETLQPALQTVILEVEVEQVRLDKTLQLLRLEMVVTDLL